MDFTTLSELELQFRVEKLLASYVEGIDEDRLEDWPDFFTDPCLYKVISRENADRGLPASAMVCDSRGMLTDRVVALRQANIYAAHFYRHVVSNTVVHAVSAEAVQLQSNYVVFQTKLDGDTEIYSAGRYFDSAVWDDDELKYKEKTVIFDTNRIPSLLVTPI